MKKLITTTALLMLFISTSNAGSWVEVPCGSKCSNGPAGKNYPASQLSSRPGPGTWSSSAYYGGSSTPTIQAFHGRRQSPDLV
jgi:hypothetical protein